MKGGSWRNSLSKLIVYKILFQIDEILALKGKLSQSAIGKKFGIEQTEVSQIHRSQKSRVTITEDNKNVSIF